MSTFCRPSTTTGIVILTVGGLEALRATDELVKSGLGTGFGTETEGEPNNDKLLHDSFAFYHHHLAIVISVLSRLTAKFYFSQH